MSLKDWLRNGWLIEHTSSQVEMADLFRLVARDLKDAQVSQLSLDGRLGIAYNAALQSATAALAAAGYRAARESHHYRVIQSLAHTIGADENMITQLDVYRKKRNRSDYERAGSVTDKEVGELIHLTNQINKSVKSWIRRKYPELMQFQGFKE